MEAPIAMAQYKKAIEMKCAECIYDPGSGEGTWREQVQQCTDHSCPLFNVRPLPQGCKHPETIVIHNVVEERRLEIAQG